MKTLPFKICTMCSQSWNTLTDFLSDPQIELAGYQVYFNDLEGGLFCFTHHLENCHTTMAIPVKEFTGLSDRPVLKRHVEPPDDCPSICVRQGSLEPCPVACECNWVREIMQRIRQWKKTEPPVSSAV